MMAAESRRAGLTLDMLLQDLCEPGSLPDLEVTGLATDSRAVQEGDLFLAVQGLRTHGLKLAGQALDRGAAAVLWEPVADATLQRLAASIEVPVVAVPGLGQKLGRIADRFYAHPTAQMQVIGVTGTDGKTSVTHFIAQALSALGQRCGLLGTLGYGVYGALRSPTHTTPDALRLQAEFAALRDRAVRQVAMEVSSHALHQQRTAGVAFHTAVLTHLSRDHLDYHGSVEAYAEAKRQLFLSPGLACAVLNVADGFGVSLAHRLRPKLRVIAYRGAAGGTVRDFPDWLELRAVEPLEHGLRLSLDSSWGPAEFGAPVLGGFNAENLLAALGALLAVGVSLDAALRGLSQVTTVPGRMELFSIPGAPRVVVDYAHTPHALESVLQALRPHCGGELLCVFGAGGDRDPGKRPQMGAVAERFSDRVILTNDNPRNEEPQAILDQILTGFAEPARALCVPERSAAIEAAIRSAAPDDLVLVAGKGHEDYQELGSTRRAFSDRAQVQTVLRRLGE
ncbi:MAG: UDP-N-acetylmuramoyl-L-alanyl-D-glutamate--2,6-diaminopimelate ligase [Gammaproteobacteria bacterium]|jgi:UDP-N-acetylmuramoyl-L-alanyl-D-glutamate--2,6-diaminopimelate ligase